MNNKTKRKIYGWFTLGLFLILVLWLVYSYFNQGFVYDLFQSNPGELINTIEKFGIWSYFIFILLILLECILAPFPPLILYIAGGAVFGGFVAGSLALFGNILGAAISFLIANKFGRDWVRKQIPQKTFSKIDKFSEKHGALSIFILRINPITSSDLLSYAAGFTKMNFKKFLFWTALALIPSIFLQTYIGDKITENPLYTKIAIIAGAIYFIGFLVFYLVYRWKNSKNKDN